MQQLTGLCRGRFAHQYQTPPPHPATPEPAHFKPAYSHTRAAALLAPSAPPPNPVQQETAHSLTAHLYSPTCAAAQIDPLSQLPQKEAHQGAHPLQRAIYLPAPPPLPMSPRPLLVPFPKPHSKKHIKELDEKVYEILQQTDSEGGCTAAGFSAGHTGCIWSLASTCRLLLLQLPLTSCTPCQAWC